MISPLSSGETEIQHEAAGFNSAQVGTRFATPEEVGVIGRARAVAPVLRFLQPQSDVSRKLLRRRRVRLGGAVAHNVSIPLWKRALDCTIILFSLPLWLPVMFLIVLWTKAVSPGPVFFRQERVGHGKKLFRILKFRSMKVNAETRTHESHFEVLMRSNQPMTKLDTLGDSRVIAGGKILRSLGLDELPQIFNVLCGEMSLVGPRPCTSHEFAKYEPWQQDRATVPPGLTGYWQVNGKNQTTFSEMIAMDLYYAAHMSLWLDLRIMLKTPLAIVGQVMGRRARRCRAWFSKISDEALPIGAGA